MSVVSVSFFFLLIVRFNTSKEAIFYLKKKMYLRVNKMYFFPQIFYINSTHAGTHHDLHLRACIFIAILIKVAYV